MESKHLYDALLLQKFPLVKNKNWFRQMRNLDLSGLKEMLEHWTKIITWALTLGDKPELQATTL